METTSLTFAHPLWLWGLVMLPFAAGLFIWSYTRGHNLVERIVAPRLRAQLAAAVSVPRRVAQAVLVLASLGFAFIALAQPRLGYIERETKHEGRDVVVAIDTSRSMLATDIAPTRLVRAKMITQDLLRLLQGDRVGLIAFAGSSFLQAPLTLDYNAVRNALGELDTSIIPRGGTNIAAAITSAREAFGKAEGQVRALVILTDGEELDADGIAAAKKAAGEGIRIFTVGIGSPEGSLIPVIQPDGRQDFVRGDDGKPITSKLDDSRLREIAAETGGFYLPIAQDAARIIFQDGIEPMERSEMGVFSARQPIERFQWPLAAAVLCLALSLLPGDRRRVSKAIALLILCSTPAHAQSGLQDFQNGDFEKASAEFQEALKSQPNSRKLQFNAGTAAYKAGDFESAITHFTGALLGKDRQLRENASYNLANSLVRKGEGAEQPESKKTAWESAVEHFEEALRLNPKNKNAQENLEVTKKLLEELEKQQQQDQEQEENQDQEGDKQENQDQSQSQNEQKQDDQQQDQSSEQEDQPDESQDQQKQEGSDKGQQQENGESQQEEEEDSQPEEGQEQEEQSEGSQQNQQPSPVPTPTPGEKKEGELKAAAEEGAEETPEANEQNMEEGQPSNEEPNGEMTHSQARALLNSLRGEERRVNLMEQQTSQEVLRDW